MNIVDFLAPLQVCLSLTSRNKSDVIRELTDLLCKAEGSLDRKEVYEKILERERQGSTGIGKGIALPHAMLDHPAKTLLMLGKSRQGIPFDSLDGKPAHLFFLMVGPREDFRIHLKLLAILSRILQKEEIKASLIEAETPENILQILRENGEMIR